MTCHKQHLVMLKNEMHIVKNYQGIYCQIAKYNQEKREITSGTLILTLFNDKDMSNLPDAKEWLERKLVKALLLDKYSIPPLGEKTYINIIRTQNAGNQDEDISLETMTIELDPL